MVSMSIFGKFGKTMVGWLDEVGCKGSRARQELPGTEAARFPSSPCNRIP